MKKLSFGLIWQALKDSAKGFSDDNATKLSASLAYYTVFSLGPLLIVIISVCGFFLGREAIEGSVQAQIQQLIGADAARQIEVIIKNASLSDKSTMATIVGVVFLLIGATTVFAEIQTSINSIWGLKPRPKAGWMKLIKSRLLSFGVIGALGFLLLVSLAATAIIEGIGNKLKEIFPDVAVVVFYIINLLLTLGITTLLFAIIFKVLPDAKLKWKAVWPGAIATSLLFLIGKFGISLYISKSEVGSTYGAAGSLVVLLVWIYYSSIILYFGAEFTKAYAVGKGLRIRPNEYAQWNEGETVPGAKKKELPSSFPNQVQKQERRVIKPVQPVSKPFNLAKEKKNGPGMGTVLAGLLLYFFNTSTRGKSRI